MKITAAPQPAAKAGPVIDLMEALRQCMKKVPEKKAASTPRKARKKAWSSKNGGSDRGHRGRGNDPLAEETITARAGSIVRIPPGVPRWRPRPRHSTLLVRQRVQIAGTQERTYRPSGIASEIVDSELLFETAPSRVVHASTIVETKHGLVTA